VLFPPLGGTCMPELVFVDSKILVYAHDHSNPSKQAKVRERVVIQRPV